MLLAIVMGVILYTVFLQIKSELSIVSSIINPSLHIVICCFLTLTSIVSLFYINYDQGDKYLRSIPLVIFLLALLIYRHWIKLKLKQLVDSNANYLYTYSTYLFVLAFALFLYVFSFAAEALYGEKHFGMVKDFSYYLRIYGALFSLLLLISFRILIVANKKKVFDQYEQAKR